MEINRMKCSHLTNPLGFTLHKPSFSWVVDAPEASTVTAGQVQIAYDDCFEDIVYDSGKIAGIDSIAYTPGLRLKPRTRYFWRVTAWTDAGEIMSPVAWFETSKMEEPWTAKWITPDWEDKNLHPLLRKSFSLKGEIASARVYICGLGLYELQINGEKAGDEFLAPFCNAYDKWLQYQTYDVTAMLKAGGNAIGVMLGNGWYKGRFGFDGYKDNIYGDTMALLCELEVEYTDGSRETIISDESWKAAPGFVIDSNIYDGETQDAGKVIDGWSLPGFEDGSWTGMKPAALGYDRLEARRSVPVRIMEEIKPVRVIKTPAGETVLDMGQNMVGWLRFKADMPEGAEILLQYGEELQNGCFYRENLRTAKAEFRYVSNGRPAVVQPYFTFYGFRYVKVEGMAGEINPEDFTGCVVHSDMERTGTIETSNESVNRLFLNALWGQKGNFLDVPTDCPQRDERMGWTGDAQVFSG
ncbi:MAG: family 78 glycoside hydrolase catalytic domain, partial [Clostridiales bacterium]|nr:family 78 glycoside hydrolase catalytic domain [Clostridiales bacterium]